MESTGYGRQDTPQLRMPSSNASPMILSTRVRELSQTVHPAHVTKDDACVSAGIALVIRPGLYVLVPLTR